MNLVFPIEIVVASITKKEARCQLLGSERGVLFRSPQLERLVPGEIVKVAPRKQWKYAGQSCLAGEIKTTRLDVSALGLTPLRLEPRGIWDPIDEYWGEEGEPVEDRPSALRKTVPVVLFRSAPDQEQDIVGIFEVSSCAAGAVGFA